MVIVTSKVNKRARVCKGVKENKFTNTDKVIFMFAPCINSIKALFIISTDAQNYKITGMLKQLKFRQFHRHVSVHAGTIIRELFRA